MNTFEIEDTTRGLAEHLHRLRYPEPRVKYDPDDLRAAAAIIDDPRNHLQALVDAGAITERSECVLQPFNDTFMLVDIYEIREPESGPHEHVPEVALIQGRHLVVRCADEDCREPLGAVSRSDSRIATLLEPVPDDDVPFE